MNKKQNKSGFILLAVIVVIPLVGIGIALLGCFSHQMILQTRWRTLQGQARNLAFSGRSWAELHKTQLLSAPPQQTWMLKIDSLQTADGECRIKRLSDSSEGTQFEITAVAQSGSKKWTIRQTLVLRPSLSGR
jgi:type II secretory pathway pseudopilin PulG